MDPVSDPRYNMIQVIKQSILAEEHLTHPRKRCKDCLAKHLLHMIALVEEAVWLSCGSPPPLVMESVHAYNALFEEWVHGPHTAAAYDSLAGKLRQLRKGLVAMYVTAPKSLRVSEMKKHANKAKQKKTSRSTTSRTKNKISRKSRVATR